MDTAVSFEFLVSVKYFKTDAEGSLRTITSLREKIHRTDKLKMLTPTGEFMPFKLDMESEKLRKPRVLGRACLGVHSRFRGLSLDGIQIQE